MKDKAEFYRDILDSLYDGIYFIDRQRRITFWSKGAEALTGYSEDDVMGKVCADDLLCHLDSKGNKLCDIDTCPAEKCMKNNARGELEVFVHHKEGHLIPILTRITPLLDDEGTPIGAVEVFSSNVQRIKDLDRIEELERMALLDPLTEIGNRRFCLLTISSLLDGLRRYGWHFGVVMMDIDHFKAINDAHGHKAGDQVLVAMARTLRHGLRSTDSICRWGGEEFISIIRDVGADGLMAAAEKLRCLVEQMRVTFDGKTASITVSAGSTMAARDDTVEALVERADRLMYQSKSQGRNRVNSDPTFVVRAG